MPAISSATRILLQGISRNAPQRFNPDRKEAHWGKRKSERDT
jgi:hypothetical protein